jgi:hypothetical protein
MQLMQILFDMRYFMIVMLVVIFMFGDMFHFAVSTLDQGNFCLQDGLADPTEDFCVPTTATPSYLRVYVSECRCYPPNECLLVAAISLVPFL